MSKETYMMLDDYLNRFVAYQNPQDGLEYVFALKSDKSKPLLHINRQEKVEVIDDKNSSEWRKRIFQLGKEWKKIDGTGVNAYYKSADSDLYDFFMTSDRKDSIKL